MENEFFVQIIPTCQDTILCRAIPNLPVLAKVVIAQFSF